MKLPFDSIVKLLLSSSKKQACGLTIIGIAMLISANLAEAVNHTIAREMVQVAIIAAGILVIASLFSPKPKNQQPE